MRVPVPLEDLPVLEGDQANVALIIHVSLGSMLSIGMLDGEGVRGKLFVALLAGKCLVAEHWGSIVVP